MPWTKPRTFVDGETMIASILNTHLRDNLNFLFDKDRVHAVQTQNNALKNDEWEVIKFGGEAFDRGGMHSNRKREAQIKFKQDGLYYLLFKIAFEALESVDIENVSVDVSTDLLSKNSHGLANGDAVTLKALGTVTNVTAGNIYYVVRADSDTFKISTSIGGDPRNLTGTDDNITVTQNPGERSVMLRRNSNQNDDSGANLGVWNAESLDGSVVYVDGYVLEEFRKGDHVNLFVKQNSGQRGLRALSGGSSVSYLQAVQMGGTT